MGKITKKMRAAMSASRTIRGVSRSGMAVSFEMERESWCPSPSCEVKTTSAQWPYLALSAERAATQDHQSEGPRPRTCPSYTAFI